LLPVRTIDEVERGIKKLLVDILHALLCQRTGVFAVLLAPFAEARVFAWGLGDGSGAAEHSTRTELQPELKILRIVGVLGLVFGIEVIKIAKELIEAMHGWEKLVGVAEMVLTELSGHVAQWLEQFGKRRVLLGYAFFCSR